MAETEAEQFKMGAQARSRAEAIMLEGEAEAEIMKKKAESYTEYNQAAVYEMLFKVMPELARAVSEPLSKVDKIVIIDSGNGGGASKITRQVAEILAQLPAVVESLSGVDLKKLLQKLSTPPKDAKKAGESEKGK
jgi:flotillin